MQAMTAEELPRRLGEALNSADVDRVVSFYEADAVLAPGLVLRRQAEGHWLIVIDRPMPADA